MRVLFLTHDRPSEFNGAHRQRCHNPAAWLKAIGIDAEVRWIYERHVDLSADLVILHRPFLDGHTARLIIRAAARGSIVAYETDDLLFDPAAETFLRKIERTKLANGISSARSALTACDAAIVSTSPIARAVEKNSKPAWILRNGLSVEFLAHATRVFQQKIPPGERLVLGYFSGSSTHQADFAQIEHALVQILDRHSGVHLLVVGALMIPESLRKFESRVHLRPMVPYASLPDEIARADLNLVPLELDEPFCHSKSELKYIEAAACGVPSIASSTEPFAQAIRHGQTGFLVDHGGDWMQTIESAISDPQRLRKLGEQARDDVLERCVPKVRALEWKLAIDEMQEQFGESTKKRRCPFVSAGLGLHAWLGSVLDKARDRT
ncbi:MAG: glycosyltransferase family 4 protein [Betaproteobacteria bacterium]|nr:glycosyltransferase family 4 protein [Betaproteobacteria bacterium]